MICDYMHVPCVAFGIGGKRVEAKLEHENFGREASREWTAERDVGRVTYTRYTGQTARVARGETESRVHVQ